MAISYASAGFKSPKLNALFGLEATMRGAADPATSQHSETNSNADNADTLEMTPGDRGLKDIIVSLAEKGNAQKALQILDENASAELIANIQPELEAIIQYNYIGQDSYRETALKDLERIASNAELHQDQQASAQRHGHDAKAHAMPFEMA